MSKQRQVSISVLLPVTVDMFVEDKGNGWEPVSIRDLHCSASLRTVLEQMTDDEYEAIDKAAEGAIK